MSIYEGLTFRERQLLSSLSDADFGDPVLGTKISASLSIPLTQDEWKYYISDTMAFKNLSFSELVGANKDVAKLLIAAKERILGYAKDEILHRYLLDRVDPREDSLQRALLPELVKSLRAKTGLSQRKFAAKYDVSISSLAAWEAGRKKISRYSFDYLRRCVCSYSPMIFHNEILKLPVGVLSKVTRGYLENCSRIDHNSEFIEGITWVRKVEIGNPVDTIFVVPITNKEVLVDGVVEMVWHNFPADLQECMRVATEYSCRAIYFYTKELGDVTDLDGTAAQKLEALISSSYIPYQH
ncbi:helix-turn-helix domain-containing protein [Butyrivibrio proteoclasticus]|uniref:helix-turn-helix domain-containing protein n=1 Tax=Butyrivibrio proteoclasticus TaxID=43305 RepID=UPI000478C1BA|nr:helix-turn-helix domain-containing protein [Butyrivibrio proteoclasticus]